MTLHPQRSALGGCRLSIGHRKHPTFGPGVVNKRRLITGRIQATRNLFIFIYFNPFSTSIPDAFDNNFLRFLQPGATVYWLIVICILQIRSCKSKSWSTFLSLTILFSFSPHINCFAVSVTKLCGLELEIGPLMIHYRYIFKLINDKWHQDNHLLMNQRSK